MTDLEQCKETHRHQIIEMAMEQEYDTLSLLTTTLPKITHDPDRSKLLSLLAIMGYNQMDLFTQDECRRAADRLREYRTVTGDDSKTVNEAVERLTARATAGRSSRRTVAGGDAEWTEAAAV